MKSGTTASSSMRQRRLPFCCQMNQAMGSPTTTDYRNDNFKAQQNGAEIGFRIGPVAEEIDVVEERQLMDDLVLVSAEKTR